MIPDIQNKLLNIMALHMLCQVVESICLAPFLGLEKWAIG